MDKRTYSRIKSWHVQEYFLTFTRFCSKRLLALLAQPAQFQLVFLDFETVEFFYLLDERIEIFAGKFLDFFTLSADKRVMTIVFFFFYLTTNIPLDAVNFVDEFELLHHLNNAVNGYGIEIDLMFLKGDLRDLVWRERTACLSQNFDNGHAGAGDFVAFFFQSGEGEFGVGKHCFYST